MRLRRLAAGVGLASGGAGAGWYAGDVARGKHAQGTAGRVTPEVARSYNDAARRWSAEGREGGDRPNKHVPTRDQRRFMREVPEARRLRRTVRRWEDKYTEAKRIREAKPEDRVLRHPVRSRRWADKQTLSSLQREAPRQGRMYRAMGLAGGPGAEWKQRELTPWTPSKGAAAEYAGSVERDSRSRVRSAARGLDRGGVKPYVFESRGLKAVSLDPLSGYSHRERLAGPTTVKTRLADLSKSMSGMLVRTPHRLG